MTPTSGPYLSAAQGRGGRHVGLRKGRRQASRAEGMKKKTLGRKRPKVKEGIFNWLNELCNVIIIY